MSKAIEIQKFSKKDKKKELSLYLSVESLANPERGWVSSSSAIENP
jgi:hypothetical protein